MIKRIDLFLPPFSQYSVLHHFTYKFYEALTRLGIRCRVLEATFNDPKPFLQQIFSDPPDYTLSFNGLLPDGDGHFFCDMIQIPHIACLTEPPTRFIELAKSKNTIITCMDSYGVDFFQEMGFSKVFFMPHGVEKNLKQDPKSPRDIDLLMLSTCIDPDEIREDWHQHYPAALCKVLDDAAEQTLSDQTTSHISAFVSALNHRLKVNPQLDPNEIPYVEAIMSLDDYIRGKDRIKLIHSLKDFNLHIYGEGPWDKFTKGSHAKVHAPVPYEQALKLIGKSKIVLNSNPTIKHGTHTRILAGTLLGAVPVTTENPFMQSYYEDLKDILYYRYNAIEKINEQIDNILNDDQKRISMAKNASNITLDHHTWDHRASQLLKNLSSL